MTVIISTSLGVVMQGQSSTDYFCGRCGRLILLALELHQLAWED
jgi:hypothetical protein